MITAITGHRPERIKDQDLVCADLEYNFKEFDVTKVIQGMAPGADLLAARVAYKNKIPYIAAKPYPTHRRYVEKNYPGWLSMYDRALEYADEIVDVCPTYEGVWVFQKRNEWMVDHGDMVIAVWDGVKKGGTWNCVNYATKKEKTIIGIEP